MYPHTGNPRGDLPHGPGFFFLGVRCSECQSHNPRPELSVPGEPSLDMGDCRVTEAQCFSNLSRICFAFSPLPVARRELASS